MKNSRGGGDDERVLVQVTTACMRGEGASGGKKGERTMGKEGKSADEVAHGIDRDIGVLLLAMVLANRGRIEILSLFPKCAGTL